MQNSGQPFFFSRKSRNSVESGRLSAAFCGAMAISVWDEEQYPASLYQHS